MMQKALILLIALISIVVEPPPLAAQPAEEVTVLTNLPVVFRSQWPQWNNTVYRWTVEGWGYFGDAGTDLNIIADARFVLGAINNLSNPRLPLSAKQNGFEEDCARTPGACNIYFATNARADNDYRLGRLIPTNAEAMKEFQFIPSLDVYTTEHRYVIEVIGNDGPAEFMFVDRYDRSQLPLVQQYYNDNFNGEDTTKFFVKIERVSPQLLFADDAEVLNEPDQVLRCSDLEFGRLSVGQGSRQIPRILRNGGLQDLEISRIEFVGNPRDLAQFRVTRSDGAALAAPARLRHASDQLTLMVEFDPQEVGNFNAELRVFSNDPNQNEAGQEWFCIPLRGEGTSAEVNFKSTVGAIDVLADYDFGNVYRSDSRSGEIVVESVGSSTAFGIKLEGLDPPFVARPRWGTPTLDLDPSDTRIIDIDFNPTTPGLFIDTLDLLGDNFSPQRLIVQGYSYFDSLKIFYNWERRDSLRDTIDFGYRPAGEKYDTLSFYVRNYGNMEVLFGRTDKTLPDYGISRGRDAANNVISKTEHFSDELIQIGPPNHIIQRRPLDVAGSYSEREFKVIFRGNEDDVGDFASGLKMVKFDFWLRDTVDTSRIFKKEFYLRAVKTDALLIAEPQILDFGFVYLDTEKVREASLDNCGEEIMTRNTELLNRGAPDASFDLSVAAINFPAPVPAKEIIPVQFRFAPKDLGPDEAQFRVAYQTQDSERREDTTRMLVRGVGVQQKLTFTDLETENIAPKIEDRGDTIIIDLGEVNACNDDRTFSFRLRNDGNFAYGVKSVKQRTNSVDNGFVISNLPVNGAGIEPGATFGPVVVTFAPQVINGEGVQQEVERIIESDIDERVCNAPDSVRNLVLVFRARPIAADLAVEILGNLDEEERLNFDSLIVIPDCVNDRSYSVRVFNAGNLDLLLNNVSLSSPEIFTFSGATDRLLRPGASDTITVRFRPNSLGFAFDTLRFNHNGGCPDSTFALPLVGVGVPAASLKIDIPDVTRARPGSLIELPLLLPALASQQQLSNIESVNVELEYNPTILQFEDFQTGRTASSGLSRDDIKAEEIDGRLSLELNSSAALIESDTLLRLRFRTYVGDAVMTSINVSGIRLGNSECPEIVGIDTVGSGGMFVADSVCGVHVLTVGSSAGRRFGLRSSTPNPVEGDIEVEYDVAYATDVSIDMYNSMGMLVRQVAVGRHPAGVYRARLSAADLAAGTYYCIMRAGLFSATRTLVKTR